MHNRLNEGTPGKARQVDICELTCGEDLDADLLCICSGVLVDADIEAQHNSVFLNLFEHGASLHHVALEYWSNTDIGYWNFGLLEEFQQRFEGTKSGCLHANSTASLGDTCHQVLKIAHDFFLQVFFIVFWAHDKEARAGNRVVQAVGGNLNSHCGFNRFVVDVL